VEIAVAGMKHVGDAEPIFLRKLANPRQRLRQRAARFRSYARRGGLNGFVLTRFLEEPIIPYESDEVRSNR
jgi:hypothetical protein